MGREMLAVGFFLCYCQAKVGIAHDDIQLSILLILSFSSARGTDMLFLSLSLLNLFFQIFLLILPKRYVHLRRDIAQLESVCLACSKNKFGAQSSKYLLNTTRVSTKSPLSPLPTGKYRVVSLMGQWTSRVPHSHTIKSTAKNLYMVQPHPCHYDNYQMF